MPWLRTDTQHWINQLEHRIEDIDYYLDRTLTWCGYNDVYEQEIIFACASVTVLWVSKMRGELITRREMLELVGVVDWFDAEDFEYSLGDEYSDYDHEELLAEVVNRFS